VTNWPGSAEELVAEQVRLAAAQPAAGPTAGGSLVVGGCFVCFARGPSGSGQAGDRGWGGAALVRRRGPSAAVAVAGTARAAYVPGLLALREGALLEEAVRALPERPGVLLVDGTGRDHPRRAGLALHLGAVVDVPTAGVTHRPLLARGAWPGDERGATSPLLLEGELVGYWLRTRPGMRPLAVHAGWGTDPELAVALVLAATGEVRTPEPLRRARRAAREARAASGG
jgi:deoxyribonuclease V